MLVRDPLGAGPRDGDRHPSPASELLPLGGRPRHEEAAEPGADLGAQGRLAGQAGDVEQAVSLPVLDAGRFHETLAEPRGRAAEEDPAAVSTLEQSTPEVVRPSTGRAAVDQ